MERAMPCTRLLISLTTAGFMLELALGERFGIALALWPLGHGFMPWQLVTYCLLHGSLSHLLFNLLGLWMFGRALEAEFGPSFLLVTYFASVLSAGATQLLFNSLSGATMPTIGASGGVFGLLLAFGVSFPRRVVVLLIPPLPLPAWLAVALYAAVELLLGVTGRTPGVAHFAHLGGMLGAYLVVRRRRRASGEP
ncbi:rhomboid family intramembrane serine protease [Duganella rhizosphaerae]